MRLNHSDVVLDLDGDQCQSQQRDAAGNVIKTRPLTFKDLAINALMADPGDLDGETKARCFAASLKFLVGNFADLEVDEASLIKLRAGKVHGPLAYGRICEWIEGKSQAIANDPDDANDADRPT